MAPHLPCGDCSGRAILRTLAAKVEELAIPVVEGQHVSKLLVAEGACFWGAGLRPARRRQDGVRGRPVVLCGGGVVVRTLGPGDAFGEIALLLDLPRTATVRTSTDLTVFELGRDTFLAAVTGYRTTTDAAYAAAAGHLANYRPPGLTI